MNNFAPVSFVYLSLEPTRYRSRKHRSRNYFPKWSEYAWSAASVSLALPKQIKKAGFVQAGICQLSLDFHIFSFPSFSLPSWSCTAVFHWYVQTVGDLSLLELFYMDYPFRQHGVCCHWLVLTVQIACHKPLLFNAKCAWQTQLFLYIRLIREIAVVSAQQQHLPFYIPHFVKHSVIILRSKLRNKLTLELSKCWSSSFPLHFQPGNLFFFTPLFHCFLFLLDIFAFVQPVWINRLMQSISPLSFLHYNLNLHYSAQVLWNIFPCCCFVLYC